MDIGERQVHGGRPFGVDHPANRSTCLGDDTDFGWGTEIVTTMSCSRGEARFNFRFDNEPGPNAPLVVF
ncbi:hypothetical protein ACIPX0_50580 [Streptomyces sp. NPDC090075]|uniref:hypothetical protein n=1 Tax=unclassified Streptomyces TaxID=2593676 RepID=UPI00381A4453